MALLKVKSKKKTASKALKVETSNSGIVAATKFVGQAFSLKDKLKLAQFEVDEILKELTPVESKIRELVDTELKGSESIDLNNGTNILRVSKKQELRKITDMEKAIIMCEDFEEGLALKIAKFALGDLDKYFSPDEMKAITEISEGNRRLKYA